MDIDIDGWWWWDRWDIELWDDIITLHYYREAVGETLHDDEIERWGEEKTERETFPPDISPFQIYFSAIKFLAQ